MLATRMLAAVVMERAQRDSGRVGWEVLALTNLSVPRLTPLQKAQIEEGLQKTIPELSQLVSSTIRWHDFSDTPPPQHRVELDEWRRRHFPADLPATTSPNLLWRNWSWYVLGIALLVVLGTIAAEFYQVIRDLLAAKDSKD